MSLKVFHIIFILASIAISFGFSAWCFQGTQYSNAFLASVAGAVGVGLLFYLGYFLRRGIHI